MRAAYIVLAKGGYVMIPLRSLLGDGPRRGHRAGHPLARPRRNGGRRPRAGRGGPGGVGGGHADGRDLGLASCACAGRGCAPSKPCPRPRHGGGGAGRAGEAQAVPPTPRHRHHAGAAARAARHRDRHDRRLRHHGAGRPQPADRDHRRRRRGAGGHRVGAGRGHRRACPVQLLPAPRRRHGGDHRALWDRSSSSCWPRPPSSGARWRRSRMREKAHLLRWRPRPHAHVGRAGAEGVASVSGHPGERERAKETTPRVRPSGAASHLDLFAHPARTSAAC